MKRRRTLEQRTRPAPQRTCDYCPSTQLTWRRRVDSQMLVACKAHEAQADKDWDKLIIRMNHTP